MANPSNPGYAIRVMAKADILDSVVTPLGEIAFQRLGEETVALSLENATYFGFDPIGTIIWDRIVESVPTRKICQELADRFDVPLHQIDEDVRKFLSELLENGLLSSD